MLPRKSSKKNIPQIETDKRPPQKKNPPPIKSSLNKPPPLKSTQKSINQSMNNDPMYNYITDQKGSPKENNNKSYHSEINHNKYNNQNKVFIRKKSVKKIDQVYPEVSSKYSLGEGGRSGSQRASSKGKYNSRESGKMLHYKEYLKKLHQKNMLRKQSQKHIEVLKRKNSQRQLSKERRSSIEGYQKKREYKY
jgi:hypothetical protein